jgi:hypothetical protein
MTHGYQITRTNWRGITLEIRFAPKRAPLPITGTGYRSHFTAEAEIAHWGNPEGFVLAWLADAAKAKAWTPVEATGQQLSLFRMGNWCFLKHRTIDIWCFKTHHVLGIWCVS